MDEIEKYVKGIIEQRNHQSIADFEGYSPVEMQVILYDPFCSDSPIQIRKMSEKDYDQIPLLNQIKFLYQIIKDEGELQLTKKGFLSTKTVQKLYNEGYLKDDFIELGISKLYKEENVNVLTLTRIIIELSQLVKKRNNKLSRTQKGEEIIKSDHLLFKHILEIFTLKFNWAYFDLYENEEIGQLGFGFSFVLLNKYGKAKKSPNFYAQKYLKAFDFNKDQNDGFPDNPENAYTVRTFERFLEYFGFVELEGDGFKKPKMVKKTALFDKAIKIRPHNSAYRK
ncbi:hypothetical protein C7S20_12640 [Christiangramia fulva]|uniref:Uncharacterized protein n=1 Tax=Christiangramia fulva TaxID=2126553 RepID=A0A2R3Z6X3_9FLAO|nr:hypothetical protein [Christiangramia fulva]AVR46033.1 hypothetical protein C7S20_12640 [Christiangramia fulva]